MSHFIVLAIIPGDTPMNRVEQCVGDMLEPYSEHLEVEDYETECGCIGFQAIRDVQAELAKTFNIEEMRQQFSKRPENEQMPEHWQEIVSPMKHKREKLLVDHPLMDKPDPKCSNCNGTGKYLSCYNPSSKWDWWVIGGRWDGWIFGPEREKASRDKEGGFNFRDEHHTSANNCRLVSAIPIDNKHYVPFAIITPENEWIEQGEMGWWANVSNEKSIKEWHGIVKTILAKYPTHLAVAVDCHI